MSKFQYIRHYLRDKISFQWYRDLIKVDLCDNFNITLQRVGAFTQMCFSLKHTTNVNTDLNWKVKNKLIWKSTSSIGHLFVQFILYICQYCFCFQCILHLYLLPIFISYDICVC